MAAVPERTKLETWKEVATFFGRDESTVKRWEAERGLPVHRLPGGSRSRIYAIRSELEAWLGGSAPAADGAAALRGPPIRSAPLAARPRILWRWGSVAIAIFVAIALLVSLSSGFSSPTGRTQAEPRRPPLLAAQRLYIRAMDDWALRTPESLARAISGFQEALRVDPDYAEAFAGLAQCYNLMREYTLMPPSQAYPLAKAAAEHALALNDNIPDAHASLAFVDFYWLWDKVAAEREYRRAIALDPGSATARHWHATFLEATGDFAGALSEIDRAATLDPNSLSIRADRSHILASAGRTTEAIQQLTAIESSDLSFLSPHRYLAGIYFLTNRSSDFLREAGQAARLTNDRQLQALLAASARGLASGGRRGMLSAILDAQLDQYFHGSGEAFAVARAYALLGRQSQALAYLRIAIDRRESGALYLPVDVAMQSLAGSAEYQADLRRIGPLS